MTLTRADSPGLFLCGLLCLIMLLHYVKQLGRRFCNFFTTTKTPRVLAEHGKGAGENIRVWGSGLHYAKVSDLLEELGYPVAIFALRCLLLLHNSSCTRLSNPYRPQTEFPIF